MEYRDIVDDTEQLDGTVEEETAQLFARLSESLPKEASLTPLEEQVIALGRADGPASLEAPSFVERLFGWLFGVRSASRALADPRLELLRRAVVIARHRHHLPDAQAAALRLAGFTAAQVSLIEACAIAG